MTQFPEWIFDGREGIRGGGAVMRPKKESSPYYGIQTADWSDVTRSLLAGQYLTGPQAVDATLWAWDAIFKSDLGGFKIGTDIFPNPQVLGSFLHELIPLHIAKTEKDWRREATSDEKDLVFIPDPAWSIEIKTSSDKGQIYGNRSFGQENPSPRAKKFKAGYYVAVNFEKWKDCAGRQPNVTKIRYGWLDETDWVPQATETGQQSALPSAVENLQLLNFYTR